MPSIYKVYKSYINELIHDIYLGPQPISIANDNEAQSEESDSMMEAEEETESEKLSSEYFPSDIDSECDDEKKKESDPLLISSSDDEDEATNEDSDDLIVKCQTVHITLSDHTIYSEMDS